MRITLTSVLVDDQAKALAFYTDLLGFVKKNDVPVGEHRWLTVVSPESPDGPELLLEPERPPGRAARSRTRSSPTASRSRRSPSTTSRRSSSASARPACASRRSPAEMGPGVTTAVLDDTCGNLIQIAAVAPRALTRLPWLEELARAVLEPRDRVAEAEPLHRLGLEVRLVGRRVAVALVDREDLRILRVAVHLVGDHARLGARDRDDLGERGGDRVLLPGFARQRAITT